MAVDSENGRRGRGRCEAGRTICRVVGRCRSHRDEFVVHDSDRVVVVVVVGRERGPFVVAVAVTVAVAVSVAGRVNVWAEVVAGRMRTAMAMAAGRRLTQKQARHQQQR